MKMSISKKTFELDVNRDLFERTKNIVEEIKEVKLELHLSPDVKDFVRLRDGIGELQINTSEDREGETYTSLERSLSHVLFDTPFNSFATQADKEIALTQIEYVYQNFAKKSLTSAYDILEKQRCEQNYGKIYRGTKIHFEDELSQKGEKLEKVEDPLQALEAVRQGRDDLVRGTKYESAIECMEGVVGTDNCGAIIWGNKYWNDVLKDWLQEQLENANGKGKDDGEGDGKSGSGSRQKMDDAVDKINKLNKSMQQMDQDKSAMIDAKLQGELNPEDDFKTQLGKSMKNGEIIIKDIIQQMRLGEKSKTLKLDNVYDYLIRIERAGGAKVYPDMILATKLQEYFRKIKGRKIEQIDDSGLDFDLDEAIQDKFRKSGMIYLDEEDESGLAVVIAVDLSGSMSGSREQGARNICATLFKSIKGIPKVEVQVIGWSSPGSDYGVSVNDIKTEKDLDKLTITPGYGENGNHLAMQYASDVCKKMRGHKKLVIFLTDGVPHMNTRGKDYSLDDCIELSRMATIDANKKGISTLGVYIDSGANRESMKAMDRMFLGRFVNCANMESAKANIVKEFAMNVAKVIR